MILTRRITSTEDHKDHEDKAFDAKGQRWMSAVQRSQRATIFENHSTAVPIERLFQASAFTSLHPTDCLRDLCDLLCRWFSPRTLTILPFVIGLVFVAVSTAALIERWLQALALCIEGLRF